ncbi:MAG: 50S ribosomal protein L35 [bacterium]|nr:50S ribosomal protein L35 [Clostridia bacterium]MCR5553307.1 50S ribosomal protein L35 [bacterium]
MPKQKNNSAAKKRFTVLKSGKIKRAKQNKRHILTKKETKRKRGLRQGAYVSATQEKTIKKLVGSQD